MIYREHVVPEEMAGKGAFRLSIGYGGLGRYFPGRDEYLGSLLPRGPLAEFELASSQIPRVARRTLGETCNAHAKELSYTERSSYIFLG